MKVPEFLFVIVNPIMKMILRSPLHFIFSSGVMLITFTGRKSGKTFTTPVRYVSDGDTVRCFSSDVNRWWKNIRGGAEVVLRIKTSEARYSARLIEDDPVEVGKWLRVYLEAFPEDAVYHDIRRTKDKQGFVESDVEEAIKHAVVVEATPV